MKKRILFVDDESKVLQGLRRMLRSLRREWDMEFAEGGPEALAQLAISPFDVVVSDMRMPGMDGAKLLDEVMKLYPATVRIILSGQCDRQAVLKCVGPAHQFLTKPCDSETLKSTIARACNVRDDMADERYQCTASRLATVPCHPLVYTELITELESSQPSIQRVTQIASRDVGMTAKIFQLVSSSFFGTPQRISDPARAVQLLGLDTIKPLALSTEAFIPFEVDAMEGGWLEPLTDHSLAVGTAAQAIAEAETEDEVLINDSFLAGFLHGVGMLAWAYLFPGSGDGQTSSQTLFMRNDETHANAGARLMALWGLPEPVVTAIALQQSPNRSSDQSFTPLAALHVANKFMKHESSDSAEVSNSVDADYLKRINCFDRLDQWRDICQAARPERVYQ